MFTGYTNQKDLVALYNECELSIIASEADTQGLVITEAMACGAPVIGANALAIPEVINGRNGLLFELHNPQDLAEKANAIITNRKIRQKMSKEAIKKIINEGD